MKILCIDIGNTRCHYGFVEGRTVVDLGHFPTECFRNKPCREFTKRMLPKIEEMGGIAFCSVVPEVNQYLRESIQGFGLPIFHLTHTNCTGLDLIYPNPEEIGQDRIANAIAVQEYYQVPAVIIDLGTAVTFDIISSAGYEGGIIAPGLSVMTRYLHEQTALLPELNENDLLQIEGAIGKSTVQAMQLGVAIGFSGMLDALLKHVLEGLSSGETVEPTILTTGGSIANLTKEWVHKSKFVEDLTLLGLEVAFQRANKNI